VDRGGKQKNGTVEAASQEKAKEKLKSEGYNVLSLEEKATKSGGRKKKVKNKELAVFCKQFASILRAGVPIIQALDMMSEQMDNKTMKESLKEAQAYVQKGGTLADAFKANPKVFPPIMYNMVAAGESSGNMEVCFERLATQFEKDGHIQSKIKGAMVYPAVILVVVIAVVVMMLVMVIPTFAEMFAEMGTDLPAATQMLVNFSNFLVAKWYMVIAIVAIVVVVFKVFKASEPGQYFFANAALKFPLVSNLTVKSSAATFSRTLATLLASGISLIDAVEQTAKVIKNRIIREELMQCKVQVAKGVPLSKPIRDMDIFPLMLPQMMHIGEETGNIEEMITKVADYFEEEVDNAVDALTAMMEPLIIVVMAVVVGTMVMAIYSPILSMYDAVDSY
jgi:type IV pilus assembly protein PilC